MSIVTGPERANAQPAEGGHPAPSPAGIAAARARRLLAAGLFGAHLAALVCVAVFFLVDGMPGLASAAFAAALVILFSVVGRVVQIRFAGAPAKTLFVATLASFGFRAVLMVLLLWAYLTYGNGGGLLALPLVITATATVAGWLVAELRTHARLRILHMGDPADAPIVDPADGAQTGDAEGGSAK